MQHNSKKCIKTRKPSIISEFTLEPAKKSSESQSPLPKYVNRIVVQIQKINQYRRINTDLDQDKIKQLKKKQEIQKQSQQQYHMRINNNDLMFNCNKNPFSAQNIPKDRHITSVSSNRHRQSQLEKDRNAISIIDLNSQLKQKSKLKNVITRLKKYKVVGQQKRIYQHLEQKKKLTKQVKQKNNITQSQFQKPPAVQDDLRWLDRLLYTSEESFMWENLKKRQLDIFKFIEDPNAPEFQSMRWILDKHYFCSVSLTMMTPKQSSFIDREISRQGRWYIQGRYNELTKLKDKDVQNEPLYLNIDNVKFDDLMMLGTGRLQPNSLRNYLQDYGVNLIKNQDKEIREYSRAQVFYDKQKYHHKMDDYEMKNFNSQQAQFLNHIPLFQQEVIQVELSAKYNQQIMVLNRMQKELKMYHISNAELYKKLEDQKNKLIIEMNRRTIGDMGLQSEKEEKIRMSKKKKLRNQRIKNQKIIQSVRQTKSLMEQIKSKTPKRSPIKSQSPNKNPSKISNRSPKEIPSKSARKSPSKSQKPIKSKSKIRSPPNIFLG